MLAVVSLRGRACFLELDAASRTCEGLVVVRGQEADLLFHACHLRPIPERRAITNELVTTAVSLAC